LIHHENKKYDGYRLTYQGYDFLAIKTLVNRGSIVSLGRLVGVGKESDIFECTNEDGDALILKLHRLGRTSFRSVKKNRDYLRNSTHFSWLYLSRLSAIKEFAFMKALQDRGFPVPDAVDQNRHAVIMSRVEGLPLVRIRKVIDPATTYNTIMGLMARLARIGLVHCDYNEFNLMYGSDGKITIIDFPQMVSVSHPNAQELFDRDVECLIRYFRTKSGWDPEADDDVDVVRPDLPSIAGLEADMDTELAASGFKEKYKIELERYVFTRAEDEEDSGAEEDETESDCDEDGEEQVVLNDEDEGIVSADQNVVSHRLSELELEDHDDPGTSRQDGDHVINARDSDDDNDDDDDDDDDEGEVDWNSDDADGGYDDEEDGNLSDPSLDGLGGGGRRRSRERMKMEQNMQAGYRGWGTGGYRESRGRGARSSVRSQDEVKRRVQREAIQGRKASNAQTSYKKSKKKGTGKNSKHDF